MSRPAYDSQMQPRAQEEDLNDRAWNEVVTTKLPANLEEQARLHKAWSRKRGVSSVSDLLRALLVYACCQYSFRELGMWAVLKGIGSLSERAWRKRFDQSQRWIAWLLSELLGVHQRPAWLPEGVGRVRIIDATRWKTLGGTGDDVRLHQSYDAGNRQDGSGAVDHSLSSRVALAFCFSRRRCDGDRCRLPGAKQCGNNPTKQELPPAANNGIASASGK
jgi:hypothetical protein